MLITACVSDLPASPTSGVAAEKLHPTNFAKIKLRQEALQSIFSGCLDIFNPKFPLFEMKSEFFNSHRRY